VKPFELPRAPRNLEGPVKAWAEPVCLPTYEPMAPDKNPMFLDKRVYQGSSGRVYPLPFIDRISTERKDKWWSAVHIENEYLRVMVLPEIGGRIHVGLDKTNGYDFFYRQNVIKPALVGLAGPWISGGVEFNWPQHHRPATFMPVDFHIEEHGDGSRTVWLSDYDPMLRMKGMHGVCLRPGRAVLELKVRLYNGTPLVQTFLWWANAAVRVHELYQSFFPEDVRFVADHAKRAMSTFPLCEGVYYGVDYGARAREPRAVERGQKYVPPGTYAPNDLSWYANIPVPTSYMAVGSREDFFGGYDHKYEAGVVHVAEHRIAPGKKQWTWGNDAFGRAWDRNLSDDEGPYIELMAGVYTDNQPDFSFLAPGETKAFEQYWYPIQKIGPAQKANLEAAVSLRVKDGVARVGVCVTRAFDGAAVRLLCGSRVIGEWVRDLMPGAPLVEELGLPAGVEEAGLTLAVEGREGEEVIRYERVRRAAGTPPAPASEPLPPAEIGSVDELYVTGLHLEQYRHATRRPEEYWREAVRRDAGDARANHALGLWHLRRGEFAMAEGCFRRSIERLTRRNPNPYDGEPYYNLGLALRYLGKDDEAYDAFFKATWNHAWRGPAYYAIAEMDAKRGRWRAALAHAEEALLSGAMNLKARNVAVVARRKLGDAAGAAKLLEETLAQDPLDAWALYLREPWTRMTNAVRIDLACDYERLGLYDEATAILTACDRGAKDGTAPMVFYAAAYCQAKAGNGEAAAKFRKEAEAARPDYCFPSRLEEILILEAATAANPRDGRAAYYLGNLFYDRRRHAEAIALWERAAEIDPEFPTVWRNLGIAYFNVSADAEKARQAFDRAFAAGAGDARILYERDQLWKRIGERPQRRLEELERFCELVGQRDDLSVELAALYNQTGAPEKALAVMEGRRFQPWEGGEGLALGQFVAAQVALGRRAVVRRDYAGAIRRLERALEPPESLGEAWHPLASRSNIFYWLGAAQQGAGDEAAARRYWGMAAAERGDFQQMAVQEYSEMSYYSGLSLACLGETEEARRFFERLREYAMNLRRAEPKIDYFATSLPLMLLFNDDLRKRNEVTATFLEAQAKLGLGATAEGMELLRSVLSADRNHAGAADLMVELALGADPRSAARR
jgi:tetratricopeptide (TPR) repeat protein